MTGSDESRLETALEAADEAFWMEVIKHYPEIESGDMHPAEVFFFNNAQRRAVSAWLDSNGEGESA